MEKFEHNSSEKLSDDTRKEVSAMAEKLQSEGYDITLQETSDEYIVAYNNKEHHFAKLEKFPMVDARGVAHWFSLAQAMERRLKEEIEPGEKG